jgi:hypothetical protein
VDVGISPQSAVGNEVKEILLLCASFEIALRDVLEVEIWEARLACPEGQTEPSHVGTRTNLIAF